MKKAVAQIAVLAAILLVVCFVCRLAMRNTYMVYIPIPRGAESVALEDVRVVAEMPGIVAHGAPQRVGNGYIRIPIRPQQPGGTYIDIDWGARDDSALQRFGVGRFGTVYDYVTGGFTGDSVVLAAFTVFCLAVAAIMFRCYRQARGPAFYAYTTIYAAGFSLFATMTGLLMLYVTIRHILHPYEYNMMTAYREISGASFRFMLATLPFMLVFAVSMAVSNIVLLRHERAKLQNMLGIVVSVALLAGELVAILLYARDFVGSERQWRVHNTLQNVYATGFAYFECMLIGSIICGIKAAQHVPAPDKDYILILGCRFRTDGTLTPLLQGRVDRAIEFWKAQRRDAGREAVLVPSGGQGKDEVMAEAEAMRRYLLERGIPARAIRMEDRSRNTYQNMAFCKALIEKENPKAKVAYATTNYHVFRSGVWASLAGLPAEGMGSGTKWWYWPNAFMRECAGLMKNRIPQELLLLAAMLVFFGTLSVALG